MQSTCHWPVILACAAMRLLISIGGDEMKYYMFILFKIILHYQNGVLSNEAENGQIRIINQAVKIKGAKILFGF